MNPARLILVIEDENGLANTYAIAIAHFGGRPEICRDGLLARSRIMEGPAPEVLLLDLHLPHLDGEQLLNDIDSDQRYTKTRVYIVTADREWGGRLSEEHPKTTLLIKPIDLNIFRSEFAINEPN